MSEEKRGLEILDFLLILLKWKKFLIIFSFSTLICSYLAIYFLITPKFDSKALIISSNNSDVGGISSLIRSFSDLPISIPGFSSDSNMEIFTTIIYSRTTLEKVIKRFDLYNLYELNSIDKTIESLSDNINADETRQGAYEIIIRDKDPNRAADMANYLIELLNNTLIEINIAKAHENNIFIGKRFEEIRTNLKNSEDSLMYYQIESGIYFAEEQAKTSILEYSKLEAELAAKQIKLSILTRIYGHNSPQAKNSKIAVEEYENKLNDFKNGKVNGQLLLAIKGLPINTMRYYRFFREVEIQTKMLEFIIPLFEQTKFEEQKKIPMLKVIDAAVPAEEKAFPPRILFSLIFTMIILSVVVFFIILKEIINSSDNPKVKLIASSFFFLKTKSN